MKLNTKKKLRKLRFLLIGLIIILIYVGFTIADIVIDDRLEQRVLLGRDIVNMYRTEHYCLNNPCETPSFLNEIQLLDLLLSGLTEIGYSENVNETIEEFFIESRLYNVQQLGYRDVEDFNTNAVQDDVNALIDMWH